MHSGLHKSKRLHRANNGRWRHQRVSASWRTIRTGRNHCRPGRSFVVYRNKRNQIGRIAVSGKISEYPLPTANARPHAITAGGDGALWFTEWGAGQIGRITVNGDITEYPIPTAESEPHGIAAGPAQSIWFAEECGRIGKISILD